MVTNRVAPNWCCDVCGASFGSHLAGAEACEATPIKPRPREGAVLARHTFHGIEFVRIEEVADRPGPQGHDWRIALTGQRDRVPASQFGWAPAGFLTIDGRTFNEFNRNMSYLPWHDDPVQVTHFAEQVGLPVDPDELGKLTPSPGRVLAPLSREHRELFDALDISIDLSGLGEWRRRGRSLFYTASYIDAGGRSDRAVVLNACRPVSVSEVQDRWRRWWDCEPIHVPCPRFLWKHKNPEVHRQTASKLRKAEKLALAAAGVEWPDRTNHEEFVRGLIPKVKLPMEDVKHPQFGRPTTAILSAKGGVGKSTVCAALAEAMAGAGERVLIVDCDPRNSSQHALWEPGPIPIDEDSLLVQPTPTSVDGVLVLTPGQFVDAASGAEWPSKTQEQWLDFAAANVNLDDITHVLLDMPAGGGAIADEAIGHGNVAATQVVVVVTGHRLVREATSRWAAGALHYGHHGTPRPFHLVENQSHLADGKRIIGDLGATLALANLIGMPYAGYLPIAEDHHQLAAAPDARDLAARLATPDVADRD